MATSNPLSKSSRSAPTLKELTKTLAYLETKHATLKAENNQRRERWRSLCLAPDRDTAATRSEIRALAKKIEEVGKELGTTGGRRGTVIKDIEDLQLRTTSRPLPSETLASRPPPAMQSAPQSIPPPPATLPLAHQHASFETAAPNNQTHLGHAFRSLQASPGSNVQIIINGQLVYNQSAGFQGAATTATGGVLPAPSGHVSAARTRSRSPGGRDGVVTAYRHREPRSPLPSSSGRVRPARPRSRSPARRDSGMTLYREARAPIRLTPTPRGRASSAARTRSPPLARRERTRPVDRASSSRGPIASRAIQAGPSRDDFRPRSQPTADAAPKPRSHASRRRTPRIRLLSPCPWGEPTPSLGRDGSDRYRPGYGRGRDDTYRPSDYGRLSYHDMESPRETKKEILGSSRGSKCEVVAQADSVLVKQEVGGGGVRIKKEEAI